MLEEEGMGGREGGSREVGRDVVREEGKEGGM